MLKSKIHRARVTGVNIDYEGSVAIDRELMDEADILPYEQVQVLDLHNGVRFTTYAIEAAPGSGDICVNGAAARLVADGDTVLILTYHYLPDESAATVPPRLVYVDANNAVISTKGTVEALSFRL